MAGTPDRPNVLLYVIDGAGADYMSAYGYESDTTPRFEALAREGVLFQHAHSNSAWTKSSTASFMTSLHHSVLGGFADNNDPIPDATVTMAEHFGAAGYRTAVFTTNPFACSLSGLDRGVDMVRDNRAEHNSTSSVELHRDFWAWREVAAPGPWFVHIQTTDVHEPHQPVEPFEGTVVNRAAREQFEQWWDDLHRATGPEMDTVLGRFQERMTRLGIPHKEFFETQQGLYEETMAHADHQLGELVEQLKARGEWEDTVLIVTSDHGHPAGSFSRFGRGLLDPAPPHWEGALAGSYRSRVPLLIVWPAGITGNVRRADRVSLIDLLPTVLDLAGLPPATVQQGQSLAPLLTDSEGTWSPRPIVFDQFQEHAPSGQLVGHLEMLEGRWVASLEIMPESLLPAYHEAGTSLKTAGGWRAARPHRPTTPLLLLYDVGSDPLCVRNVNADYPEKVDTYRTRLLELWEEHKALARTFASDIGQPVTDEQLEALRVLGYIDDDTPVEPQAP